MHEGTDGDGGHHEGGAGGDPSDLDRSLLARLRAAPLLAGPLPHFDPRDAPDAPGPLFARWLDSALSGGVSEPQLMTLSTADADGRPSARVLVLRGVDTADCACLFASDSGTRKGQDLAANPWAALTWYWAAQGRQIRMTGSVDRLSGRAVRDDYLGRSEQSRVAGRIGSTSQPLAGPDTYERARRSAQELVAAEPEHVPDSHAVYRLRASEAEFFQADPARLHVRLRYTRGENGWTRTLLWP